MQSARCLDSCVRTDRNFSTTTSGDPGVATPGLNHCPTTIVTIIYKFLILCILSVPLIPPLNYQALHFSTTGDGVMRYLWVLLFQLSMAHSKCCLLSQLLLARNIWSQLGLFLSPSHVANSPCGNNTDNIKLGLGQESILCHFQKKNSLATCPFPTEVRKHTFWTIL